MLDDPPAGDCSTDGPQSAFEPTAPKVALHRSAVRFLSELRRVGGQLRSVHRHVRTQKPVEAVAVNGQLRDNHFLGLVRSHPLHFHLHRPLFQSYLHVVLEFRLVLARFYFSVHWRPDESDCPLRRVGHFRRCHGIDVCYGIPLDRVAPDSYS